MKIVRALNFIVHFGAKFEVQIVESATHIFLKNDNIWLIVR